MSQPSLSESIQRLERDLEATVFYRSRSGIQLTPRGREFVAKVQQLLGFVQELEAVKRSKNVFGGQTISIGCHATVASYTIPAALEVLRESAPDFKLEFYHDLSRNIQYEIQRGRLDVGVVINPIPVPDIVLTHLGFDFATVWVKAGAKPDILIHDPDFNQTQWILKRWKNPPVRTLSTNNLDLICRLVGKGLGYGILPYKAVELSGEKLIQVASLPVYKDRIVLVHRPEFGKTAAEKAVISAVKAAFPKS